MVVIVLILFFGLIISSDAECSDSYGGNYLGFILSYCQEMSEQVKLYQDMIIFGQNKIKKRGR